MNGKLIFITINNNNNVENILYIILCCVYVVLCCVYVVYMLCIGLILNTNVNSILHDIYVTLYINYFDI